LCDSKSSKGGTGVHRVARPDEAGKKDWFYVHSLPEHPSYLAAKKAGTGERIGQWVEAGRNGRGIALAIWLFTANNRCTS